MTYLLCIGHQNFTRIHIEKGALLILIFVQQNNRIMTKLVSAVRDYNHTLTESSHVVASIKCGY